MAVAGLLGFLLISTTPLGEAAPSKPTQTAPAVKLGYVILYVPDVESSLSFYESAFGLTRRFHNNDSGKAYGELETGAARLGFVSAPLALEQLGQSPLLPNPDAAPLGVEVALTTTDVRAVYDKAIAAGAKPVKPPQTKPWGQTVAYVRDNAGHLVEICTPMP